MLEKDFKISVVISTYNKPEWLEKSLWGFENQSFSDFEIIIADDGSSDETRQLINRFQQNSGLAIQHIWQEDFGFRKCSILNKAVLKANYNYLLFTDGDCVPKYDFLEVHANNAEKGYFLSGGYFKLPLSISKKIGKADIENGNAFSLSWLKAQGISNSLKNWKLSSTGKIERFLNLITPTKSSWNGHNSSGWKSDILSVNGFNEDMAYGGEDREFGERLYNLGIKSKQIRYSAICLHLEHDRSYVKKEMIDYNLQIRKDTVRKKRIVTPNGIEKL